VWIHTGHVMCSWTHLDPSFIPIDSLDVSMISSFLYSTNFTDGI
jgi:hypothetical protein